MPDPLSFTTPGIVIASPRSGAGKTTVTLGLLRALNLCGLKVQPFKCGPDYIDPAFHTAAANRPSINLDSWAMRRETIDALVRGHAADADLAVCEGLMGLFDGATMSGACGTGASADLAALTGWPVILVLDVSGQSQTAAAVALGCARYRADVEVAGVILNRVGSERHRRLVSEAIESLGLAILGALPRRENVVLPERHLGLVQAEESADLTQKLDALGGFLAQHVDLNAIRRIAGLGREFAISRSPRLLAPPGQRIAVARDAAFSFVYEHLLSAWRASGAEIIPFSPLADEPPCLSSDVVWLPGGYPELHAGTLSHAYAFMAGLRSAAAEKLIHGECGGFMVLGNGLEAADGQRYAMAGLLGLETSFLKRRLHLGYRKAVLRADCTIGKTGTTILGHEFHYASILANSDEPLADIVGADGYKVGDKGARRGGVSGTFFHMIDLQT
jgi:cobyrinic acid a,c-diamide synthase